VAGGHARGPNHGTGARRYSPTPFAIASRPPSPPAPGLVTRAPGLVMPPNGSAGGEAENRFSYPYVIHFAHPPWRADRNDPRTLSGPAIPF
jgi:hypothetical protein